VDGNAIGALADLASALNVAPSLAYTAVEVRVENAPLRRDPPVASSRS
jgi:hypothetical protein